jgi:hypothetical protein
VQIAVYSKVCSANKIINIIKIVVIARVVVLFCFVLFCFCFVLFCFCFFFGGGGRGTAVFLTLFLF